MLTRAILVVAAGLVALPAAAGDLKIIVEGIRSDAGTVLIGLYDTKDGFRSAIKRSTEIGLLSDSTRVAGLALRAVSGWRSVVLGAMQPGRYAVIAYHDENDDGKLGTSPWGVPTEGYAFSNNARGLLQAPSFDAADFVVGEGDTIMVISLGYPKHE